MTPPNRTLAAAAAAVGLLLTGCSSDPTPEASGTPTPSSSASASASASPTASASPSSTLSAARQRAVDEAAGVILAYEQMFEDIPADPEPYLNDINNVATQPQLDRDLRSLQDAVVAVAMGKLVIEDTGPVTLAAVDPVKFNLKGEPPTVILEVCVDKTGTRSTYEGKPVTGSRQLLSYRVVKTTYLPEPGWAVAQVLPPKGFDQPQPC